MSKSGPEERPGRQPKGEGLDQELPGEDRPRGGGEEGRRGRRRVEGGDQAARLTVEGVGVVFFLSRPGRGLAGTLAVLLAFRPDSRSSSGRLFSALLL